MSASDNKSGAGVLDCNAILDAREKEDIVIEPFNPDYLKGSSYDVTLGPYYYLEQTPQQRAERNADRSHARFPFDEGESLNTWGTLLEAEPHLSSEQKYIVIPPGMTVLAYTNEFIGDRTGKYTTMMKSRSSLGRSLVETCKCAGWGDPGYYNRWTMEMTNTSALTHVYLPVGARVAQIVFLPLQKGEPRTETQDLLLYRGKYQPHELGEDSYYSLLKDWCPTSMLPALHRDLDRFVEPPK